jgi:hypothetical protein
MRGGSDYFFHNSSSAFASTGSFPAVTSESAMIWGQRLPQSCGENIPTHVHTTINLLRSYLIKRFQKLSFKAN